MWALVTSVFLVLTFQPRASSPLSSRSRTVRMIQPSWVPRLLPRSSPSSAPMPANPPSPCSGVAVVLRLADTTSWTKSPCARIACPARPRLRWRAPEYCADSPPRPAAPAYQTEPARVVEEGEHTPWVLPLHRVGYGLDRDRRRRSSMCAGRTTQCFRRPRRRVALAEHLQPLVRRRDLGAVVHAITSLKRAPPRYACGDTRGSKSRSSIG